MDSSKLNAASGGFVVTAVIVSFLFLSLFFFNLVCLVFWCVFIVLQCLGTNVDRILSNAICLLIIQWFTSRF